MKLNYSFSHWKSPDGLPPTSQAFACVPRPWRVGKSKGPQGAECPACHVAYWQILLRKSAIPAVRLVRVVLQRLPIIHSLEERYQSRGAESLTTQDMERLRVAVERSALREGEGSAR
jgi:hypothetical protein